MIKARYDLKKFDEVTVNRSEHTGRDGFVVVPRYQSHLSADGRFVEFGCVVVKFFGDKCTYLFEPDDVVIALN